MEYTKIQNDLIVEQAFLFLANYCERVVELYEKIKYAETYEEIEALFDGHKVDLFFTIEDCDRNWIKDEWENNINSLKSFLEAYNSSR